MRILKLATTLLLFVCSISWAQEKNSDLPVLKTKVKTIAVFKNGIGFVYRSGQTQLKNGWAKMDAIPQAALGTLWFGSNDLANPIEQVLSYQDEVKEDLIAVDFAGILSANIGKAVTIFYNSGNNGRSQIYKGNIVSVPIAEKKSDIANTASSTIDMRYVLPDRYSYSSDYYNPYYGRYNGGNPSSPSTQVIPQIVTLMSSGGLAALNIRQISDIIINDPNPNQNYTKTSMGSAAKIKVKNSPKNAEISESYLIKGITWSPSYILDIKNPSQAVISMDAVLANDAEDIEDAEISFTVGNPNFLYTNIVTPMNNEQSVSDFVKKLMTAPSGTSFAPRLVASALSQNSSSYTQSSDNTQTNNDSMGKPINGESNEDLFFYTQAHVTMPKGSRARYSVFNEKVNYKYIYELELQDLINRNSYYGGYYPSDVNAQRDTNSETQVWHSIRLTNASNKPFTTAPILVMNGTKPVSQDILKYTPPGASNIVKMTVATDIKAEQTYIENSRDNVNIAGSSHVRVALTGKISVKNYKNSPETVIVTRKIFGEIDSADFNGKISTKNDSLNALNPNSAIVWEFELGAGKTQELNFKYKTVL